MSALPTLQYGKLSIPVIKCTDMADGRMCRALQSVCDKVGGPAEALLEGYKPRAYVERVGERSMASLGCEPILHMRGFQKAGRLPQQLESDIKARAK